MKERMSNIWTSSWEGIWRQFWGLPKCWIRKEAENVYRWWWWCSAKHSEEKNHEHRGYSMHQVGHSQQFSVKHGWVNACMRPCSFMPSPRRADGLTLRALRICLWITGILIFCSRSRVVVKAWQLWQAKALQPNWGAPAQPTDRKCLTPRTFVLFLTKEIGRHLRLALASGIVNWFLCCLGLSLSVFFNLGFPLQVKK